ncbi:MAG: hypothetical protein ACXABY_35495 [Candidatus Thorarchaeota archaeon]|jgi:hypothetical protein
MNEPESIEANSESSPAGTPAISQGVYKSCQEIPEGSLTYDPTEDLPTLAPEAPERVAESVRVRQIAHLERLLLDWYGARWELAEARSKASMAEDRQRHCMSELYEYVRKNLKED